jgi:hypothetical protein
MNIDTQAMIEGFRETLRLFKEGENVFDMGNSAMFPAIQKQTMWKYNRGADNKALYLSDGTHVYAFSLPEGERHDSEFPLMREADMQLNDFGKAGKTGPAQVHRADPGSIYFTLQEGFKNPTYTFRHVGGQKWRGIPKAKAAAKAQAMDRLQVAIPDNQQALEQVKQGMVKELLKQAGIGQDFNLAAGQGLTRGLNGVVTGLMAPGRLGTSIDTGPINPALAAAGIGAGAGALYHFGKRTLYNTPEENEEEDATGHPLLRRMAIPAVGLGLMNSAQRGIFGKPTSGGPGYYDKVRQGNTPKLLEQQGEMVNPLRSLFNK